MFPQPIRVIRDLPDFKQFAHCKSTKPPVNAMDTAI